MTRVTIIGGVIAITSRIIVVDLLTERVPAEKVTGIVVWDAHRVSETSSEVCLVLSLSAVYMFT